MYKCAIIGVSGERARGHAEAYKHIHRGELVTISSRQEDKLNEFGDRYQIGARYPDYREMLEKEKPDLVHVNTPPNVRLEIMQAAEAAGIPALLVEKPIAIQGEDFMAIRDFARSTKIKIAVNHQLHFHPRRMTLQRQVRDGKIGDVRLIEATARYNLAYQGTHSLQAIGAFNPLGRATSVFGQVSGPAGLQDNPAQHFAPDQCVAAINFDNGVRGLLQCGENAPSTGDRAINLHKRVAVYGTRGFVHWTMWSWETNLNGKQDSGVHSYWDEDLLGQAGATEAMFDWMESDRPEAVHPLNLDSALRDMNIILGIYMSALNYAPIKVPVEPALHLISDLRVRLGEPKAH